MTDWSIMQERPPAYWPLGPAIAANIRGFAWDMEEAVGFSFGAGALVLLERHEYFVMPTRVWKDGERRALKRQLEDPDFVPGIRKQFERLVPAFEKMCAKLATLSPPRLPNEALWRLYGEWESEYLRNYVYSEPPAFVLKDALSSYLEERLKARLAKFGREEAGRRFALLIATPEKPFATREEESLLKLLQENASGADLEEGLALHARKFGWIPFDYGNDVWDAGHFCKHLSDLRKQNFDAHKRLQTIRAYYAGLAGRQDACADELGLNEVERAAFRAIRDCAYLIDFKKEVHTKGNIAFQPVWREIARRAGIAFDDFRFTTDDEVRDFLLSKQMPAPGRLRDRKTCCAWLARDGQLVLLESAHAKAFFKEIGLSEKSAASFAEVKGTCGCAGRAVGRARVVVHARDIGKLKAGEVLVTMMTTPDFVSGMKKAAAIVTNEGGMTCHAAIVAREMGVPCVVGTGNATKAFKDGDLLEVKASHGVVRKVK